VISVALSHVLARTPYRLGIRREALRPVLTYSWPLLLNGGVIFLAMQGDRILIGALKGMSDLAGYLAVAVLTGGTSSLLGRLFSNLCLPLLSEAKGNPALYAERCRTTGAAALLLLSGTLVPLGIIGAPFVVLLFGAEYATSPVLVAFLAIQGAVAMQRAWCASIMLSLGWTRDWMVNNLLRIAGLGGAFVALSYGHGVVWVAGLMCAGDVASITLSLFQVMRRVPEAAGQTLFFGAMFAILAGLVLAVQVMIDPYAGWFTPLLAGAACSGAGVLAALSASADLRQRLLAGSLQLLKIARP
jgi:O-antigen/teichoic acid export membrane protein